MPAPSATHGLTAASDELLDIDLVLFPFQFDGFFLLLHVLTPFDG